MANYDSSLTGAQIESALEAVNGLIGASNNGKIICVENGALAAKSAIEIQGGTIDALTVTANGTYTHAAFGGYSPVVVNVPTGAVTETITVTENGTYTPSSGVDGYSQVSVNVPTSTFSCVIMDMDSLIYHSANSYFPCPYLGCGSTIAYSRKTVEGESHYCIYMQYLNNKAMGIPIKVPVGASTLHLYIEVEGNSSAYSQCLLKLGSEPYVTDVYGNISGTIYKSLTLTRYNMTVEQVRAQTGLTIPTMSYGYSIPAQWITIDLSAISNDSYIIFQNCDSSVYIYGIYAD